MSNLIRFNNSLTGKGVSASVTLPLINFIMLLMSGGMKPYTKVMFVGIAGCRQTKSTFFDGTKTLLEIMKESYGFLTMTTVYDVCEDIKRNDRRAVPSFMVQIMAIGKTYVPFTDEDNTVIIGILSDSSYTYQQHQQLQKILENY